MPWIAQQPLPIPVTQRTMLVTVKQPWVTTDGQRFRYRIALAIYIHRWTEECNTDDPSFDGEYHAERDEFYWREGWYEVALCHWEYSYWPIDGEVVAMQPAPKAWEPEPPVEEPDHIGPCPRCGGSGGTPELACCGNGTVHGCCGDPVEDRAPCPDCQGTGNNYEGTGIPEELWGLEAPDADGGYRYPCNSCGEDSDIMCDPTEFNPDYHYCGRSPRCCP